MASIPKEIAAQALEIARSGLVAGSWYAATYPDVEATGLRASEHYAWLGARLGRRPVWSFDTRFYRETNEDRLAPGENPVLHYLREGQVLGRPRTSYPQALEVLRLSRHLWGALPQEAGARLAAIAGSRDYAGRARAVALIQLAGRADFDGRTEEAAALLARIEDVAPEQAGERMTLMRRGVLAERLGRTEEARAFYERVPMVRGPDGSPERDADAEIGLANLAGDDAARLAALNALLARRGLEPLACDGPLRLAGLAAADAPQGLPDLGLVSVVVPAYRAAESLPVALRSLLRQSYPHLEIIVVDDASPDDTFAVAEAWAARDPRVRPLHAPRNGGAYAARNIGLAAARGAYVTTHDADDWSHPRKIEMQLRGFLADPEIMATAVHWARVRPDMRATTNWRLEDVILHLSYSSLMMRREAADVLGPWDEVRTGADSEYLWRLRGTFGRRAFVAISPDTPLAFGLDEEGSLTRSEATHLVTNYHGRRLLYREGARHHIATAPDPNDPAARRAALARLPLALRGLPEPEGPLDLLVRCDLFDPDAVEALAALLEERAGARVGILHDPTIASDGRRFASALWGLLDGERVRLVLADPGPEGAALRLRAEPARGPEPPVTPPDDLDTPEPVPGSEPVEWSEERDE